MTRLMEIAAPTPIFPPLPGVSSLCSLPVASLRFEKAAGESASAFSFELVASAT